MSDSIVFLLFIQVVLIALNAIFASAEIAVLSINETKLERMAEEGNKKAKRLFRLTQEYYNYKMAAVIGIVVFVLCAAFTLIAFGRMTRGDREEVYQ